MRTLSTVSTTLISQNKNHKKNNKPQPKLAQNLSLEVKVLLKKI
jgi:hypothetical protein